MRKKLSILLLMFATVVFWIPAEGSTPASQPGKNKSANRNDGERRPTLWQGQPRRRRVHPNKNTHGYRNYGQYRRTQVGNRRYRLVRKPYWRDGSRLTRLVRVYY